MAKRCSKLLDTEVDTRTGASDGRSEAFTASDAWPDTSSRSDFVSSIRFFTCISGNVCGLFFVVVGMTTVGGMTQAVVMTQRREVIGNMNDGFMFC